MEAGIDLIRDEMTGQYTYMGHAAIDDASSQTPNPYADASRHEALDLSCSTSGGSTSMIPSISSHWLFNAHIQEGLGDNDLLLAFKGKKKDRRVRLRVVNGLTEAYEATGHKQVINPQDLVEEFCSYGVTKLFKAAGLYLVCKGDHIGKLVRRASEYYGPKMEHYKDPLWMVQVVSVIKESGKYIETIQTDYACFHLRGTSLAEVHETRERRTAGNAAMTIIREKGDSVFTNGFYVDNKGLVC